MVADPSTPNFDREITPASLRAEVDASDVKYSALLSGWNDRVAKYIGPGLMNGTGPVEWDPENHAYEYITMLSGNLVLGTPTFRCSTGRQGPAELDVKAGESALNRWVRQSDLRGLLGKALVDYAMHGCMALVTTEQRTPTGEGEDAPYMPIARLISPKYYRADALAEEQDRERWRGHLNIRPIGEVIKAAEDKHEDGWDLEALREIEEKGPGMSGKRAQHSKDGWTGAQRDDFAYWEIWVRDDNEDNDGSPDEGFNGRIYTIPADGEFDDWVREPRAFFGLRSGPYEVCYSQVIPGEAHGLAPLVAHHAQAEFRNRIARANIVAVEAYKRVMVTRSKQLADAIVASPDLHVHHIEDAMNLAESIMTQEIGGLTQQMIVADERADRSLQRVSGLADFEKGATANITATEIDKLASAASRRVEREVDQFQRFVLGIAKRVLFYMLADDEVVSDLGEDVGIVVEGEDGQPRKPKTMTGGLAKKKEDGITLRDFEGLDMTIEAFSMARASQQQNMVNAMATDETLQLIATLGPQAPYVNWTHYAEQKEKLQGLTAGTLTKLFDPNLMREFGALMLQMQAAPPEPQAQRTPQPRLSFDTSARSGGNKQPGGSDFSRGTGARTTLQIGRQPAAGGASKPQKPAMAGAGV